MTQIIPKFEGIRFSTSKNVYKKPESKDSTKLFEIKKQSNVIAFFHAILNKLFGSKTITQSNIEVVTSCAIKNIDTMKLTTEDLIEARKITNEMSSYPQIDETTKNQLSILKNKIDTKIAISITSKYTELLNIFKSEKKQELQKLIVKDLPRSSQYSFKGTQLVDTDAQTVQLKHISDQSAIVVMTQRYQPVCAALKYEVGDFSTTKNRRSVAYDYTTTDNTNLTIHATEQFLDDDGQELVSVYYDIVVNQSEVAKLYANIKDSININPIISITVKNCMIDDRVFSFDKANEEYEFNFYNNFYTL